MPTKLHSDKLKTYSASLRFYRHLPTIEHSHSQEFAKQCQKCVENVENYPLIIINSHHNCFLTFYDMYGNNLDRP